MPDDKLPKQIAINLDELDIPKIFRVGDKVKQLLNKKISNPMEAYLLLKILTITYEEALGLKLTPEEEEKLRAMCSGEGQDFEEEEP